MSQVKDVMTFRVEIVHPDDKLTEAASKMKTCDVDMLPVCEGETLVGLVTEDSVKREAEKLGLTAGTAPVRDVMTTDLVYLDAEEDVKQALHELETGGVYETEHVLVVDAEKRPVGVVSKDSLARNIQLAEHGSGVTAVDSIESVDDLVDFDEDNVDHMVDASFPASDPPPAPSQMGEAPPEPQ